MEPESEDVNPSFSSCNDSGEILIEDDGKNGCGKGRVCKIIHGPAENLPLANYDGGMGGWGDSQNRNENCKVSNEKLTVKEIGRASLLVIWKWSLIIANC